MSSVRGFVALFLFFIAPVLFAAEVKIGYVDLDKALEGLPQARKGADELNRELEAKQLEIDQKRERLTRFQTELERNAEMLSEEQRREREQRLQDLILELKRLQKTAQDDLNYKRNQILNDLQKQLIKVVSNIGKRGKYTLIVHDKSVLYIDGTVDITNQVLEEMKSQQ